jgi:Asp-tRNA(Asn)/Glu-tRNA(Gln) amidotransferase A subunit family amidase
MPDPEILSVRDTAAGIAAGRTRAEDVIAATLARAHAAQDRLNCFTLILDDEAMAAARAADAAVAAGGPLGPLHGVPVAVKDLTPTRGHLTTLGSHSTGDWVPDRSALVVRRLEAAGAVVIGKTTTPEFAHSSFTYSPRWGVTRNPWDPERSPGGSSGGSGAAGGAGVVAFAEGTDMGGSIRIPAAFCGVVGFKPSLGRIPMTILPSQFDDISHFGPLARSVDDAIAFMAATAGPSDEDISSLPLPFDLGATRIDGLAGRRFALSMDLGHFAVDPAVEAAIEAAVEAMRRAGAVVDRVRLPWTREVGDRWFDLWCVFMAAFHGDRLAGFRDRMDPVIARIIDRGLTLGAAETKRIEILRSRMWAELAPILADHEALLCPTCAVPPPLVTQSDDDFVADGPDGRYHGLEMTAPFNLLSPCPALSLPAGLTPGGLPVGLQIVGRRHADEGVLALAGAIETALLDSGLTTALRRGPAGR